jgi:hypothetical protein
MSTDNFIKGECRACGGSLEFPVEGVGETIECPHCGQPTKLAQLISPGQTKVSRRKRLAIAVAIFFAAATPALVMVLKKGHSTAPAVPAAFAAPTNAPLIVEAPAVKEFRTNDIAISAIALEKTPGSSLVYATGKIRNLSPDRRFGVKIELDLFDTNDVPAGHAKDYQPLLEPGAGWNFKALVMESKAAKVRFHSIREDQK